MNNPRLRLYTTPVHQSGAALVIGLILLLVLTLLAISGMNTSTLELQMTGNQQFSQNAFQAAETGIEASMQGSNFDTGVVAVIGTAIPDSTTDRYDVTRSYENANGETDVTQGTGGFSMGVGEGFKAYHFDVTSTGQSARNATSVHTQSFYIVGQAGS